MVTKTLLGEPVLLARDADGNPFALHDICPHRGIPLSVGAFDGREVECCYHGWRFDREGRCTTIPSLVEGQKFNVERVGVQRYPCREVQGNIWVYFGDDADDPIDPPEIPEIGNRCPNTAFTMDFPCHVDHAVIGLMDPAHGPFVHRAWWWRTRKSIHEKSKAFAPAERGFKMVRHPPSSNSAAYKLLGGEMTTEISFQLPSIRIEHIRAGKHVLCGLTAVTPINEHETELNHQIYWTQPWLTPLIPLLRPFARTFLKQDLDVVTMQQEGLKHNPQLMLINDADMPAKWYFRLKDAWAKATDTGAPFENPVEAQDCAGAVSLGAKGIAGVLCIAVSLAVPEALAWKNGPKGNKVTNSLADCEEPPYSTHDWIADHARALLPESERAWLDRYRIKYLIGTEAPDYDRIDAACGTPNRGYDDTGKGRHDLRFDSDGKLSRDTPARRAQEEYDKAAAAYRAGDPSAAAYYLGAATHYPADLSQYGHTIREEQHHRVFEIWAREFTKSFNHGMFGTALRSDGLQRRSAYDATVWIGRIAHEGGGAVLPAFLMDDLWHEKDPVYVNSVAESLNNAVNAIADMLHTFYLDVVANAQ